MSKGIKINAMDTLPILDEQEAFYLSAYSQLSERSPMDFLAFKVLNGISDYEMEIITEIISMVSENIDQPQERKI